MRHLNAGIWNSFANPFATNSQESISHTDLIIGYTELIQQRVQDGWQPYLITFMFKRLPGNRSCVINQMTSGCMRRWSLASFESRVHQSQLIDCPYLLGLRTYLSPSERKGSSGCLWDSMFGYLGPSLAFWAHAPKLATTKAVAAPIVNSVFVICKLPVSRVSSCYANFLNNEPRPARRSSLHKN